MRRLILLLAAGCHDPAAATPDAPDVTVDAAVDAPAVSALPQLAFCTVADPVHIATAYTTTTDGSYVNYTCAQPCAGDWHSCQFGYVDANGQPIRGRGGMQMQALVFVVDGMGGHFVFAQDGTDVVVTHAGSGGTSTFNPFDRQLMMLSANIKTVTLGWALGTPQVFNGGGWFTRKDATPTSTRAQTARPAAAIQWVHDNLAAGHKLGTVGSSMGTAATLGARLWHGLDSIIDYQLLIGGPGYWDVNAGCGRIHISAGFCDVDASACTGNPMSSYGDNDPTCGTATNSCRVPTIMAPIGQSGSAYDNVINYVGMTAACAPQASDARDPSLDASSFATTVTNWNLSSRVDFVANEGGTQPPDADQGMGEGHMLYLYNAIQSEKGWTDNEGHHHGDAWDKDPVLMQAAAQLVVDGME